MIRPFRGLRPAPGRAEEVAAPPYDVLNSEEARQRAAGRPWSFLHISKPEIDLPPGTNPYDDAVYAKGLENFQQMVANGVLQQDAAEHYYLYRLVMGAHQQFGLVAAASVTDYDSNRIRKHEYTRPDKEDDRVRQIDTLNAQTGPVFLTYRHHPQIDNLVATVAATPPELDLVADDGVQHTLWVIAAEEDIATITTTFAAMDHLYIADGHHRSASASRVAKQRQAKNPQHHGSEPYNRFLAVLFPDSQVQIFDYNRVVTDLNGLSRDEFLAQLQHRFTVTAVAAAVKPEQSGCFGMYLEGQWYRLELDPKRIPAGDPVAALDVSILAREVIEPLLGIDDPRRDKRIDFVGGIRGMAGLEKRVDSGEMAVAFSLYPTSLQQLMAVADADRVMPPKSTWFEPKLADGLVSLLLD
ncbi:MAG: DUF1015 domain-containing protein [Gammaproteobacteria bacterium]|nr:DUF1015 domain-containing protein [Gammaproteobacteria bacterium]